MLDEQLIRLVYEQRDILNLWLDLEEISRELGKYARNENWQRFWSSYQRLSIVSDIIKKRPMDQREYLYEELDLSSEEARHNGHYKIAGELRQQAEFVFKNYIAEEGAQNP